MWIAISSIATVVIAIYAVLNFKLSKELKKANDNNRNREDEFKEQVKDLYQGIVISNLLSGPHSYGSLIPAIEAFNSQYTGKVKIFNIS